MNTSARIPWAYLSLDGLVESIGLNADAPYGGLCVAYFNGDYPTALDDYEADFLKSLTPEDRVRLPEFCAVQRASTSATSTTPCSRTPNSPPPIRSITILLNQRRLPPLSRLCRQLPQRGPK